MVCRSLTNNRSTASGRLRCWRKPIACEFVKTFLLGVDTHHFKDDLNTEIAHAIPAEVSFLESPSPCFRVAQHPAYLAIHHTSVVIQHPENTLEFVHKEISGFIKQDIHTHACKSASIGQLTSQIQQVVGRTHIAPLCCPTVEVAHRKFLVTKVGLPDADDPPLTG